MANLLREQSAGAIGRREWWGVSGCTAVVAYGSKSCGISITDGNRQDITGTVASELRKRLGKDISVVSTIDSVLIECVEMEVAPLLMEIEKLLVDDHRSKSLS
jgi:hypothetical protein